MNIIEDMNLRKIFIKMSTNEDIREAIKYYEDNNLKKEEMNNDFLDILETLTSEEIDERLRYTLADNLKKDIKVSDVYEALCRNENCNDSQLKIIAQNDLSKIAIEGIINNRFSELETIDLAIKNSTDKRLYDLISKEIELFNMDEEIEPIIINLNKESLFKLMFQSPEKSKEKGEILFYITLKKDLTKDEIDIVLNNMKKNEITMDGLYSEELLNQKEITKEQIYEIVKFEKIPDAITFEYGINNNIYSEEEIMDIFKKAAKSNNIIESILVENNNTPLSILTKIYNDVDKYSQNIINQKINKNNEER